MDDKGNKVAYVAVLVMMVSIFTVIPLSVYASGTAVVSITNDAGAAYGDTDTVPIIVDDGGTNMNLGSGIINVTYDSSVVIVTGVTTGTGNALPVQSWSRENIVGWVKIVSMDGSQAHNGSVIFANVTYQAAGSGGESSPLNITVISLRDWVTYAQIPRTVSNGTFTVFDSEEPPVTDPSANPATILNDNGRPRPPGTNISQLNVTVTDSGTVGSVSIDLSPLGGSITQSMTPGSTLYTVITNATIGINETHNLAVNATDTAGNSNTSVSIPLTVLRRGDIVRDNVVDDGDLMYLAKYIVGKEPAPDQLVADVWPANSWDGVDDADLMYIAKYIVGKESEP